MHILEERFSGKQEVWTFSDQSTAEVRKEGTPFEVPPHKESLRSGFPSMLRAFVTLAGARIQRFMELNAVVDMQRLDPEEERKS